MQSYRIYMRDLKQAALIADRCAIQRYGLRAKTNFDYSQKDLFDMLEDIKADFEENVQQNGFVVSFKSFCPPEFKLSSSKDLEQQNQKVGLNA
jgi:hypothetical protein